MELICELNDKIILGTDGMSTKAPRITARAIVKNQDGLYQENEKVISKEKLIKELSVYFCES